MQIILKLLLILHHIWILLILLKNVKPYKLLVKSNEVLVIDFKTGKINQKHMEQIVAYSKLLEEIFKKPVRCLLYYSALNQLTEL